MTKLPFYRRNDPASKMMSRLMAAMPAGTFEMETFSRLAGIVATTDVPTAAMECRHRPRLLLNPDFVARYCKRDEHLFLLVMHELWHVLLAHTSLYPRVTQAQNIAFDAIINSGLRRRFDKPEYSGFFEALNPVDQFPHLLLRPPRGWPDNPQYPTDIGPPGTVRILRQLYPPETPFTPRLPFYDEILALIKQDMREKGLLVDVPVLLGDHHSRDPYRDSYLKDAMGRVARQWPMGAGEFGVPPGSGGSMNDWQMKPSSATQEIRREFAGVLRRCLLPTLSDYRRKERSPLPGMVGRGVLPNPRDRTQHARRRLGTSGTLWEQRGTQKARVPARQGKAHVYLDVSGSMKGVLPYLLNLLLPYVAKGQADVFQFSTEVEALSLHSLRDGLVATTGGTNINCVMSHLIEHGQRTNRALILTDGYTGRPETDHITQVQTNRTRVHVVLPHETNHLDDLSDFAASMTVLPALRG